MDKVGINAPSGNVIHFKSVERAAELFGERGWDVTIGEDVYTSFGRFGGSSDSARLNDFQQACSDTELVLCARGGYGFSRLLPNLDFNKIIACGGSWMVSKDLVAAKDWAGITALTKEAVSTMLGFKLLHVGVNNASEEAAASDSAKFATLLGQDVKVGNSSMFVGSLIEMMKNPGRGTCGHIAIQTNYLARAMYHLEKRGFVFDESSFKYDAKGNITVAYLKDEIAGFAVHFNQK